MSNNNKRTYNTDTRDAHAAQTRSRILQNAKQLFASNGFEHVTIENIAKTSQVSAPTVYALFKSKLGVLRAVMDEALPTDQFEGLVEQAIHERSPNMHLLITAKIARQIYDAEKSQMAIFHGASVLAPELKKLEEERENRRYARLEETMKIISSSLRHDISISKAHDTLWALTGRDMYRMLVVQQGWTSDAYEQWLGNLLINTLLSA